MITIIFYSEKHLTIQIIPSKGEGVPAQILKKIPFSLSQGRVGGKLRTASVWEKRTVAWPHLLKYRFSKDPDVPPTLCWETGTNEMHKTIDFPVG